MSKIPEIGERAISEAADKLMAIWKEAMKHYHKSGDLDKANQVFLKKLEEDLKDFSKNQPLVFNWITHYISMVTVHDLPVSPGDILLTMLIFYRALGIQKEIDDLADLFQKRIDEEKDKTAD